jgi:hypothetical protein
MTATRHAGVKDRREPHIGPEAHRVLDGIAIGIVSVRHWRRKSGSAAKGLYDCRTTLRIWVSSYVLKLEIERPLTQAPEVRYGHPGVCDECQVASWLRQRKSLL